MDVSVATSAADTAALDRWPRVADHPRSRGKIRVRLEDFQVDEQLGFCPTGSGEHVFLQIRKRGLNTAWVAAELARLAGLRPMDVGYAGLKDRHAVTTQWFSVYLRGKPEPDWASLVSSELEILEAIRHRKKLRPGALRANCFKLLIRELDGDLEDCSRRLTRAGNEGVPNYFGVQRFGHDGANLIKAAAVFQERRQIKPRRLRGIYLSAARALLFNRVLSHRVRLGLWSCPIPGDAMMLDGRRSFFRVDQVDEAIAQRSRQLEIHPTGPLWGRGIPAVGSQALALEEEVLASEGLWRAGLEGVGLEQDRRALRIRVTRLQWEFVSPAELRLSFELPPGAFATSVLREIVAVSAP